MKIRFNQEIRVWVCGAIVVCAIAASSRADSPERGPAEENYQALDEAVSASDGDPIYDRSFSHPSGMVVAQTTRPSSILIDNLPRIYLDKADVIAMEDDSNVK